MAPRRSQVVFQLRIELRDVVPTVWRRLLVAGGGALATLHDALQDGMGWTDSHLHSFLIGDELFGMDDEDAPEEQIDEGQVSIIEALADHDRFVYEYDFGDGWEHDVEVEAISSIPQALKFPVCIAGENACPPEDCGGPHGFEQILEAAADPSHPEHDDVLRWLGGPFDRAAFDLAAVNAALQRSRRR